MRCCGRRTTRPSAASTAGLARHPDRGHIAVLLVFIRQLHALSLPVDCRALEASTEVTPVPFNREWAIELMRTRRHDHIPGGHELRSGGQDPPVPGGRPRLHEENDRCGPRCERHERRLLGRRQLPQHVRGRSQIRRRQAPGRRSAGLTWPPGRVPVGPATRHTSGRRPPSAASRHDRQAAVRRLGASPAARIGLAKPDGLGRLLQQRYRRDGRQLVSDRPRGGASARPEVQLAGRRPVWAATLRSSWTALAGCRRGGWHPVGRVRGSVGLGGHDRRVGHSRRTDTRSSAAARQRTS